MQKYLTKRNLVAAIASGVGLIALAVWEFGGSAYSAATQPQLKSPEQAVADKASGKQDRVDFTVMGVKEFDANSTGTVQALLNSQANFRDASNFTVVLKKGCGVATPAVGTHVVVTGPVTDYKGKPEIVVTKKEQVTLDK